MSDIAIIGNLDEILPFKVIGFSIYPLDELAKDEKTTPVLKDILSDNHRIVFVTESYFDETLELLETMRFTLKEKAPLLMPVTNGIDFQDKGRLQLKQLVERAIGIDIFKEQ